jgi:hypothetical protein
VQAYCSPAHRASVNGVAFAPHELGLVLAAASSDGSLSVITYRQADDAWTSQQVKVSLLLATWGSLLQGPKMRAVDKSGIAWHGMTQAASIHYLMLTVLVDRSQMLIPWVPQQCPGHLQPHQAPLCLLRVLASLRSGWHLVVLTTL